MNLLYLNLAYRLNKSETSEILNQIKSEIVPWTKRSEPLMV